MNETRLVVEGTLRLDISSTSKFLVFKMYLKKYDKKIFLLNTINIPLCSSFQYLTDNSEEKYK